MNQHILPPPAHLRYPPATNVPLPTLLLLTGRPKDDLYATPGLAAQALLAKERFPGSIWEPAAGMGHLVEALTAHGADDLFTSDINHYKGAPIWNAYGDFTMMNPGERRVNHIVTNPPFKLAEAFARQALSMADTKVALLLPLQFLESLVRIPFFDEHEPARIWIFRRRLTMYPFGQPKKTSAKHATAWFVWDQSHRGRPQIDWLYDSEVSPPVSIGASDSIRRAARADEVSREHVKNAQKAVRKARKLQKATP